MTDLLSAIREFRFLEEKRRAGGLSGEEQERWDQLRGILGERSQAPPATPATPATIDTPGIHESSAAVPAATSPAPFSFAPSASATAEEPPMVDADLLEEGPAVEVTPPESALPVAPAPEPVAEPSGWPAAAAPAAPWSPPDQQPVAFAGWPMAETVEPAAPVPPATEPPAAPWIAPVAPLAPAPAAVMAPNPVATDEPLLSVTEFLAQAPLALAPVEAWPATPPPGASPPTTPPPVEPAPPSPPSAPWFAPETPAPAEQSPPSAQWFTPATPPAAAAPPPPWPEPVARSERAVWPARINTAPPWPATPAVAPTPAAPASPDPDQDLPVAVDPVAVEPDAMDLLSETPQSAKKSEERRGVFVEGEHRVVVHTLVGALKRGTIRDLDLESPQLELTPQSGGDPEWVPCEELKAIFFMLPPGQPHLAQAGQRLTVTFHDGRQITGFSSDYRPGDPGFFLIPADTRSATARIYVFRAALRDVMAN